MQSPEIQQIKDRLNIVDVVGGYVQLKKAGRNFTARCPFHKERTPSFMVSPERGTYICFGCGEKGDIFSFVEKMDGIDFKTALAQLAERAGVTLPKFSGRAPELKEKDERLREACEEAAKFFEHQLAARADVQKYLHDRAVTKETIALWRIGYAPAGWEDLSQHLLVKGFSKDDIVDAGFAIRSDRKAGEIYDRFRGRIMFPIFDAAGKVIAFSGRFFERMEGSREEGEPAKYVNSPETALFKKSRVLYGFNRAKEYIRKADCILLVEGQFDMILSQQSGLPFAVAVSGTALTPEHLSLLGRFSKRLVLALDNDAAGLRAGQKSAAMALAAGFDVKIPQFSEGKDPADMAAKDPELLKAAVRGSLPAVEFFLIALRPLAKDERGYKRLVEEQVLPLIAAIPSKIEQAHFVHKVAERLRVPEDAVRAEVAKAARTKPHEWSLPEELPVRNIAAAATTDTAGAPSPHEKAALLLLVHFGADPDAGKRVYELLGTERAERLRETSAPDAERLRFEFEALGEDEEAVAAGLMEAIERGMLDEEISAVRDALRTAEMDKKSDDVSGLNKKLTTLARRRQELRQ